jgi:hypothetical protein
VSDRAGPSQTQALDELPLTDPAAGPAQPDDWPHTRRVLPWLIALFMAMVFLVPFDSVSLPFSGPFELKLDRIVVVLIALVWLAVVAAGKPGAPRFRRSPVNLALAAFAAIAVTSVLINLEPLANALELSLALKKLVLLGAYIAFFFIVATSVRPGEARPFAMLLLGLATVTAVGVIYEYRTDKNLFFDFAESLMPSAVEPRYDSDYTTDAIGRREISGPAAHGLAVTTMLAMAVPIALVAVMRARTMGPKLMYSAITAIVLGGSIATVRKSAAIVPAVGFVVLALYRPRATLRLAPLFAALVILVHFMAPGAMGSIKGQFFPQEGFDNSASVQARTEDYVATQPDLKNHPIIGRGYGTYDPEIYRVLDNEYLGLRITVGWLGYAAYLLLMLAVALVAHRVIRTRDPSRAPVALAALSAAGAVAVASKLYDALAFPQVPYIFLFLAALAVVLAAPSRTQAAMAPSGFPKARPAGRAATAAVAFAGPRKG